MMKKYVKILFVGLIALIASGCATSQTSTALSSTQVHPGGTFNHVSVQYASTCDPAIVNGDLKLPEIIKKSMDEKIVLEGMDGRDYYLKTFITSYEPGNAFARKLIPGSGSVKICAIARVYDGKGKCIAVARSGERQLYDGKVHANIAVAKEIGLNLVDELMKLTGRSLRHKYDRN